MVREKATANLFFGGMGADNLLYAETGARQNSLSRYQQRRSSCCSHRFVLLHVEFPVIFGIDPTIILGLCRANCICGWRYGWHVPQACKNR
jgi:hypothetical protein